MASKASTDQIEKALYVGQNDILFTLIINFTKEHVILKYHSRILSTIPREGYFCEFMEFFLFNMAKIAYTP